MNIILLVNLVILGILVLVVAAVAVSRMTQRVSQGEILVIKGRSETRFVREGSALVVPGLHKAGKLLLKPVTITWKAERPLPTSAEVAVIPDVPDVAVAAERLLDAPPEIIGDIAGSFLIAELQRLVKETGYLPGHTDADLGKALRDKLGLRLLELKR